MVRWLSLAVLFFAAVGSVRAENVAPEELQKQAEFKKLYATGERVDQVKAADALDGASHPSSRQLLSTVVTSTPYAEVRNAHFARLAKMPATDPGLSVLLANLFRQLKPTDIEGKTDFAKAMKPSEFKFAIYEALAEFGSKLRYPDLYTGNYNNNNRTGRAGGGGGMAGVGGDPNFTAKKQRKEFEDFLAAFAEVVPDAKLKASDRNSPVEFRKWFDEVRVKSAKKDKELTDKYVAEAREAADKNNVLVLKKKDGAEGEGAEKKDVAEKKDEKKEVADKKDEKKDEAKKAE